MRIGVLTSGGDCPGLNAVIRSVVHRGLDVHGDEILGIEDGFRGLIEGRARVVGHDDVTGLLTLGGTILGSARVHREKIDWAVAHAHQLAADLGIDALIAIGGEGTLAAARKFSDAGLPVVGVPKTIDNDIDATDATFGFDTAVHVATEAIDRLKTTAESHQRVLVVELMGRHTGWIALTAGIAGGAHGILIPEKPFDIETVARMIEERFARGKKFAIVAVAEGAVPVPGTMLFDHGGVDQFGHRTFGGIGTRLADELEDLLGKEARPVILGHTQRGGTPTARDRVLATRFGWHAVEAVHQGLFGHFTALRNTEIKLVPVEEAITRLKTVPPELWAECESVL
ncbi:ATP-dependent 6-phosphofructokinase [Kitasatospora acidiphila]|uniref:ATP-dependent 6-phosphofructokinase n=1 Tax=Kitasatospora acidiphila TaxID=2567942 RepID=A0A540W2W9_9ACTN|nr:6-phosphofructokinase [Kitasatospora acidiphila]TQF03333.1 ATP-dependent 6-phosphofructokinase [Kitasatospora acidiphila]